MTQNNTIDRRTFLLGTAATLAASASPRVLGLASGDSAPADVIVVGAGLAGLAAALTLEAGGASTLVLEAQRRVGGKMLTFSKVPGLPEAGGQSIGAGYGRLIAAANQFGVKLVDVLPGQMKHRDVALILDGQVVSREAWATSPRNPFPGELHKLMPWEYAPMVFGRSNPLQRPEGWYEPANAALDTSVHEFLRSKGATEEMIALAYNTNTSYGTSAHDVSALQMFFIESWGRVQRQIQPQYVYKAADGNQRIPEAMARALKGTLRLDAAVRAVDSADSGVTVTLASGERLRAKAVVLALPYSVTRQLAITPLLKGVQAEAIQTLGHQPITQFALVSRKPFWKQDGIEPSMWSDGLLARSFAHREGDEVISILVTAYGNKATILDRLGREGAAQRIIAEFEAARPAAKGQLRVVAQHSWSMDPWAAGDWAIFAPGTVTRFMPAMYAPHGRIHFCGEQTAIGNRGMEGAMESGERAAIEALDVL
ncbi:MAG: FAD-dependent oxidoreductase [Gammaproteobacteria bacterium]|nr:FAD-dependent oxidoreductase [Gammaproteobacteria bacterium]